MEITFTKSARPFVLNALGMATDDNGIIIDAKTREKVLTRNGEIVHIDEFCGICKGFGLVKEGFENIVALHDYIKEQKEKEKQNDPHTD